MTLHLRATGRHLPYGIAQCYLPPDTRERAPPNPSHARWYSIYLPRRDGRLSWPSWLHSAPAGSRTSNLSITSPTPNRCTPRQPVVREIDSSSDLLTSDIDLLSALYIIVFTLYCIFICFLSDSDVILKTKRTNEWMNEWMAYNNNSPIAIYIQHGECYFA